MGCHNIKQGILQQNLSKYYRFELSDTLCEQFNKFINTMKKKEKEEMQDKSCLTDIEKKQVMDNIIQV